MSDEWTKEPWRFDGKNSLTTFNGDQLLLVGVSLDMSRDTTEAKANAARIVACVNACSGIPTAQLPNLVDEVRRLRELLAEHTRWKPGLGILANGKSTHGNCCTCETCRHHHDDCVCEHNEIEAAIQQARAAFAGGEK